MKTKKESLDKESLDAPKYYTLESSPALNKLEMILKNYHLKSKSN